MGELSARNLCALRSFAGSRFTSGGLCYLNAIVGSMMIKKHLPFLTTQRRL
jgi:hypothetical protein